MEIGSPLSRRRGRPCVFRSLQDLIVRQAAALSTFGIQRGDVVAALMPGGPESATLFLAVTNIACVAPLNPDLSDGELRYVLTDLESKVLICPSDRFSRAKLVARDLGIAVIEMVTDPGGPAGAFHFLASNYTPVQSSEDNGQQGYRIKIHTSGTTAKPKLVGLTAANINASVAIISKTLRLESDDRSLCIMPLFHTPRFDCVAFGAQLVAGSSVALPGRFSAFRFVEWIDQLKPTWYSAVPAMQPGHPCKSLAQSASVCVCKFTFH